MLQRYFDLYISFGGRGGGEGEGRGYSISRQHLGLRFSVKFITREAHKLLHLERLKSIIDANTDTHKLLERKTILTSITLLLKTLFFCSSVS